jgi:hypothetical protein
MKKLSSGLFSVGVALAMSFAATSQAAVSVPGVFSGDQIDYSGITEDSVASTPPLYGSPTVSGDSLFFTPGGFGATASGEADLSDGTLTVTATAAPDTFIESIDFSERGTYTLFGSDASVFSQTTVTALVTAIDGVSIDPEEFSFAFPTFEFSVPEDGSSPILGAPWSTAGTFDVASELDALGYAGEATEVVLNVSNFLVAVADDSSVASIGKNSFVIGSNVVIPEPGSLALLAAGLGIIGYKRRSA